MGDDMAEREQEQPEQDYTKRGSGHRTAGYRGGGREGREARPGGAALTTSIDRHGVTTLRTDPLVDAQSSLRLPTVVIATCDRRQRLLATLAQLHALAERPPIVVVDNASSDGTVAAARRQFPDVKVIESGDRLGSAARTLGVEVADTPLVAFSDDDSWWAPGALRRAATLFEAHARLGLIAARIIVEPDGRLDPTCHGMRASPLEDEPDLPGPPVLGFLACAAIARRDALLACGGFHPRYGFGGEEHLLAVDLAAAGWGLAYVDGVIAHHEPASGPRSWQGAHERRNLLWSTWLRRPLPRALQLTGEFTARGDDGTVRGLAAALRGLPWVMRERRVVPTRVERRLRLLERIN